MDLLESHLLTHSSLLGIVVTGSPPRIMTMIKIPITVQHTPTTIGVKIMEDGGTTGVGTSISTSTMVHFISSTLLASGTPLGG